MKILLNIILISFLFVNCSTVKKEDFQPRQVYQSDLLMITQITAKSFLHTSYKQTNDFGNVPCNGLFVTDNKEAMVFDTPTTDESSVELIRFIKDTLGYKINGIIPTHFHDDCLGGLQAFINSDIPSFAHFKTIELAQKNKYAIPENSFKDSLTLKVGDKTIVTQYFGEGHTKDNIVGYFPSEAIMFGGCLIKEMGANKGYLGDANVSAWSQTVRKVKSRFPDTKLVVPGHGKYGHIELLEYTINLFKPQ